MPVQPQNIIAAYERLETAERPEDMLGVGPHVAELTGAAEYGLITMEIETARGEAQVRNLVLHTGTLGAEALDLHLHDRAQWWSRQPAMLIRRPLPRLFLGDPQEAGEAFAHAGEQVANPRKAALCAFHKVDNRTVAAFLAAGFDFVPGVCEIAIFHGLAGQLSANAMTLRGRAAAGLSQRERECLLWSARGKTSAEIAGILELSEHTVNHYLTNAAIKLGASNRVHAIIRAMILGLLQPGDI